MQQVLFSFLRTALIAFTGNGYNRSRRMNRLHHKLSYRLHKALPSLGISGIVTMPIPGLPTQRISMDASDGGVAHQFIVYHTYEPYESSLVRSIVNEGMTVYNVGANIGYYTILSSTLVGQTGKVFAFEPHPDNFKLLSRNVEQNQRTNVTLLNEAVSDKEGSAHLFLSSTNSGDHRIFSNGSGESDRLSVPTKLITLDGFIREGNSQPDVIIMDIQGAEGAAMEGFKEYLSKRNDLAIFLEFWPDGMKAFGYSGERLLDLLSTAGLKYYAIDENKKKLSQKSPEELLRLTSGNRELNLLAISDSRKHLIADQIDA